MEGWQSWSIASDLKSDVLQGTVGSNPTPSAKQVTLVNLPAFLGYIHYGKENISDRKSKGIWKLG